MAEEVHEFVLFEIQEPSTSTNPTHVKPLVAFLDLLEHPPATCATSKHKTVRQSGFHHLSNSPRAPRPAHQRLVDSTTVMGVTAGTCRNTSLSALNCGVSKCGMELVEVVMTIHCLSKLPARA